jgi:hypothetical protein
VLPSWLADRWRGFSFLASWRDGSKPLSIGTWTNGRRCHRTGDSYRRLDCWTATRCAFHEGEQGCHRIIQAFAGDHRYVADYLVEEVLRRQPEPIRNFLLQASILDRMNGSLCDAVLGNHPQRTSQLGGKARLESLQWGNLFLLPLDDKRDLYRYHHLFADILRIHLMAEQPDRIESLHSRASEWYEKKRLGKRCGSSCPSCQRFQPGGMFG